LFFKEFPSSHIQYQRNIERTRGNQGKKQDNKEVRKENNTKGIDKLMTYLISFERSWLQNKNMRQNMTKMTRNG